MSGDRWSKTSSRWPSRTSNADETKATDWRCKSCDYSNFADRRRCRNCARWNGDNCDVKKREDPEEQRVVSFVTVRSNVGETDRRDVDWVCRNWPCTASNYGFRDVCHRCHGPQQQQQPDVVEQRVKTRAKETPPRRVVLHDREVKKVCRKEDAYKTTSSVESCKKVAAVSDSNCYAGSAKYTVPPPPLPCTIVSEEVKPQKSKCPDRNEWIQNLEKRFGPLGLFEPTEDVQRNAHQPSKSGNLDGGSFKKRSPAPCPTDRGPPKQELSKAGKPLSVTSRSKDVQTRNLDLSDAKELFRRVEERYGTSLEVSGLANHAQRRETEVKTKVQTGGSFQDKRKLETPRAPKRYGEDLGYITSAKDQDITKNRKRFSDTKKSDENANSCALVVQDEKEEPSIIRVRSESPIISFGGDYITPNKPLIPTKGTKFHSDNESLTQFDRNLRVWIEENQESRHFFDKLEDKMLARIQLKKDARNDKPHYNGSKYSTDREVSLVHKIKPTTKGNVRSREDNNQDSHRSRNDVDKRTVTRRDSCAVPSVTRLAALSWSQRNESKDRYGRKQSNNAVIDDDGDPGCFQPRSKRPRVLASPNKDVKSTSVFDKVEVINLDEIDPAKILRNLDKMNGKEKEQALKQLGISVVTNHPGKSRKYQRYENGVEIVTLDDDDD